MTTLRLARADVPELLTKYALVHDAMVRDADRLRVVLERDGRARAAGLARWFARFAAEVEHHHEREDRLVFPEVRRRSPSLAAEEATLTEEHRRLHAAMEVVGAALAELASGSSTSGSVRPAVAAAAEFADVLVTHLRHEEEAVFPRIAATFTAEAYGVLERRMLRETPMRIVSFEAPWALDGLDAGEQAAVLDGMPSSLRLLHRFVLAPAYRRLAAPLAAS